MIEISSDKKKLDIDFIHRFLKTSYWANRIPRAILQKSIDNSFCLACTDAENRLALPGPSPIIRRLHIWQMFLSILQNSRRGLVNNLLKRFLCAENFKA